MILVLYRALHNIYLPLLHPSIIECSIFISAKYILEWRLSYLLITLVAIVLFHLSFLVLLCIMHSVAILIVQETELATIEETFVGTECLLLVLALGEWRDEDLVGV